MRPHLKVTGYYEERLEQNNSDKVIIADAYVKIEENILKILSDFSLMRDAHLDKTSTAKHRIELTSGERDANSFSAMLGGFRYT